MIQKFSVSIASILILNGCSDSSSKDSNPPVPATGGLVINVATDFTADAKADSGLTLTACPASATEDTPEFDVGLDCDGDGGVVAFQTPTTYKLAFKRLYVVNAAGDKQDVFNSTSLADIPAEQILYFDTNHGVRNVSLGDQLASLTAGDVKGLGFELYYFDLTITMYGESRQLRIYMSDDDFADQGSHGHHQGDITYFTSAGVEHWAKGGQNWFADESNPTVRPDAANGAAGVDAETGHQRGMFGDAAFWNESARQQGPNADLFTASYAIDTDSDSEFTLTFSIKNSWFYEDFSQVYTDSFDPCEGGTLEGCGAAWAPLFPHIAVKVSP